MKGILSFVFLIEAIEKFYVLKGHRVSVNHVAITASASSSGIDP